jgi:hypothetical protein
MLGYKGPAQPGVAGARKPSNAGRSRSLFNTRRPALRKHDEAERQPVLLRTTRSEGAGVAVI